MRLRNFVRRLVRGPEDDPRWARPLLLVLLGVTAGLYLWDLGASGWANAYCSAAVQGVTKSWKAFFFGSFDSASFIAVDKTPRLLVGDGHLGADPRRERLEHPRAAGPGRRRLRGSAVRRGAPLGAQRCPPLGRPRRRAHRRRSAGAHAGRRAPFAPQTDSAATAPRRPASPPGAPPAPPWTCRPTLVRAYYAASRGARFWRDRSARRGCVCRHSQHVVSTITAREE